MDQSNYDSNIITWLRVLIEHILILHFIFFIVGISKWEEFTKLGTSCPGQYFLTNYCEELLNKIGAINHTKSNLYQVSPHISNDF